jgi:hypothetical protein
MPVPPLTYPTVSQRVHRHGHLSCMSVIGFANTLHSWRFFDDQNELVNCAEYWCIQYADAIIIIPEHMNWTHTEGWMSKGYVENHCWGLASIKVQELLYRVRASILLYPQVIPKQGHEPLDDLQAPKKLPHISNIFWVFGVSSGALSGINDKYGMTGR